MIDVAFHEHPTTGEALRDNVAAAAFLSYRAQADQSDRTLETFAALEDDALASLLSGAQDVARVLGALIYWSDVTVSPDDAREWVRRQS